MLWYGLFEVSQARNPLLMLLLGGHALMLYTGSGVYSVVTVIRSLVVPCLYLGDLRDDVLEKLKVNII